ncbi:MAG: putative oxidoreductase, family [Frankiales bacterium]|nr:putative oxidoreductase, family [Frankiales bacterium]
MREPSLVPGRFAGKKAVVVGGGQLPGETIGNGRAVATLLAAEGAEVLVVDRDAEAAGQTVDAILAAGGAAHALRADIASEADCQTIRRVAVDTLGQVDILHNNVGIVIVGSTEDTALPDWQRGFDVNLTGMWLVSKLFLPAMRERRSGCVINVSSMAGGLTGSNVYSLTKSAVNALTRGLALEYAPHNVRVNAIAPGMMDTPIGVDRIAAPGGPTRAEIAAQRAAMVPMRRQGDAWDVAYAAGFLASDQASFVTGVIFPVDGGSALSGAF